MSLVGHLDIDRSDRLFVGRAGTLRDLAKAPIDVVVDNLSATGCLLQFDGELPLGALISIGIPGIGTRHARVSRVDGSQRACTFIAAIGAKEIAAALSADTVVAGAFPIVQLPAVIEESSAEILPQPMQDYDQAARLPIGTRFAVIAGASAALWAVIVAGAVAILR